MSSILCIPRLPTWLGYSVGRWDGDTLVVETAGFNGKTWLDLAGHPSTDALHITSASGGATSGSRYSVMYRLRYELPRNPGADLRRNNQPVVDAAGENRRMSGGALSNRFRVPGTQQGTRCRIRIPGAHTFTTLPALVK